jgi:PAS domain S-box-containing protein
MMPDAQPEGTASLLARIRELESRLQESEETLEAIRHGDIDAVVVSARNGEPRVYTLEGADRPYQVLIEQIQEGAVTLRDDGTVLYCNRRLGHMLGVPQERLIGRNLKQFLVPATADTFAALLREAQHAPARDEFAFQSESGRTVPVYVSLSLLHDSETTLFCGVLTDLTEQKLHLQELAEANARLLSEISERERAEDTLRQAQKMDAIGHLTGGIAHDFNNMLQGVTSGITLAQRRIASGRAGDAVEFLNAALVAADRAATLTSRLLGFGRRQALDPRPVALDELIRGMQPLIQRTVGSEVKIELNLKENCWPVRCDPHQLESALLNLAINARDAMVPGGALSIQTAHASLDGHDTSNWGEADPGDYVRLTVTDTGAGMPADVLEHAFEPFFTTKPHGQGTGLGLSQTHGFVRQSRGLARLESRVGFGTSVHLYLPRSDEQPVGTAQPAADHASRQAALHVAGRILLVEDEAVIRGFAASTLQELGYRVVQANDGRTGLKALQDALREPGGSGIDLLVTDVGLPGGLNGRQLADAAREMAPRLPILLITGYAGDAVTGPRRLGPGMELLPKPFELDVLANRVQAMLGPVNRN